jgi:hypothetical protein
VQVASPADTCFKYAGSTSAYTDYARKQHNRDTSPTLTKPPGSESVSLYSTASTAPFNVPLNLTDRNDFQCYIADIDLISDVGQYYDEWTVCYRTVLQDMTQRGELPIRIDLSENFTLVTSQKGRIYSFGQIEPYDKLHSVL